jgi:hypothetical protein
MAVFFCLKRGWIDFDRRTITIQNSEGFTDPTSAAYDLGAPSLVQGGVSIYQATKLLGLAIAQTREIYAHLARNSPMKS